MRAPSTGRLGDVLAGLVLVLGEFDNQNAILGSPVIPPDCCRQGNRRRSRGLRIDGRM
jgi:hypothetical protein